MEHLDVIHLRKEIEVFLPHEDLRLEASLIRPDSPRGLILFVHGSGSGVHSPRNQRVSSHLAARGFATLLVDLLTEEESRARDSVFDLRLLTARVLGVTHWLRSHPEFRDLYLGYFGASTGAAAMIRAAAQEPEGVCALVSRGGRPDLAWESIDEVKAPTLLIVGEEDEPVTTENRKAYDRLCCVKDLIVVEGAGHLFEEEGALDEVAIQTGDWFEEHIPEPRPVNLVYENFHFPGL